MKVDFSTPILDLKGKPIVEKELSEEKDDKGEPIVRDVPVTLGSISAFALCAQKQGDKQEAGETSHKRFRLALKVGDGGVFDLKAEEITLIKSRIAAVYAPLYVGRAWDILDPEAEEKPVGKPKPAVRAVD